MADKTEGAWAGDMEGAPKDGRPVWVRGTCKGHWADVSFWAYWDDSHYSGWLCDGGYECNPKNWFDPDAEDEEPPVG